MIVECSRMNKVFDLIPLYSTEKNGKTRVWKSSVHFDPATKTATSVTEFGQEGGKMQTTTREYIQGKNIGKKNETTSLSQCTNEIQRKWQDKKEKEGYITRDEEKDVKDDITNEEKNDNGPYYPMLANTYDPHKQSKNGIVYPCYVQPKLDGLRCVTYMSNMSNKVVFQSRTAGVFETLEHLNASLESIFRSHPSLVLDGELYTTDIPFEELAGLIKKRKITQEDKERLKHVSYHIYDVIIEHMPFSERYDILKKILNTPYRYLKLVPTHSVETITEFKEKFSDFVSTGFEGIMLRNKNGIYRCNYRSNDLQKYKEFFEEEYVITDFKEGDGRDKGAVIWVCQTPSGGQFHVRPRGTMEMRQQWFSQGASYIGKKLTVVFQELSATGIPRFPVGKSIREGF